MATTSKPIKADPVAAPEAVIRTPENTPIPGGGRWFWDAAILDWVDVTHGPDAVIEPPALEPINETTTPE